ncbi:hypothetical protein MRB53_001341 [Persea americana]|uniref:Uncharacterized protein n=1 Tax=Persea americana TaxID=3435 RepID=A0ACC2MS43_PERAE|nr:hypothetical protein MRB53_001341 [Persea americana]
MVRRFQAEGLRIGILSSKHKRSIFGQYFIITQIPLARICLLHPLGIVPDRHIRTPSPRRATSWELLIWALKWFQTSASRNSRRESSRASRRKKMAMSSQSSNIQEGDGEIELEEQLAKVRRKRPRPTRDGKDRKNDALAVIIKYLISSINSTTKTDGSTITECIASLKKIPNVPDKLYIYALNAFRIKEYREIWVSEDDDRMRMLWLKMNADGDFVA